MHRHALVAQRDHLVGLADARIGDSDRVAVEVADGACEAEERLARVRVRVRVRARVGVI